MDRKRTGKLRIILLSLPVLLYHETIVSQETSSIHLQQFSLK